MMKFRKNFSDFAEFTENTYLNCIYYSLSMRLHWKNADKPIFLRKVFKFSI